MPPLIARFAPALLRRLSVATAFSLLVTVGVSLSSGAMAAPTQPHYTYSKKQEIGEARAAAIAARNSGGKVLKVKRQGDGYRVKVLQPSGRVKNLWIDARSGKVKGQKK